MAWNARDVGSIPALDTIFPSFIAPTTVPNLGKDFCLENLMELYPAIPAEQIG